MTGDGSTVSALTGRIGRAPDELLRSEILDPQFRHDVEHLLPHYVRLEKVLLAEYERMGILTPEQVHQLADALDDVLHNGLKADPEANLTDVALAIERRVTDRVAVPVWHVDRSRNDLQASAQLMFGREQTLMVLTEVLSCAAAARRLARRYTHDVLPGYTHLQAAQVITPGFFVSALSAHLLHTTRRILATYDGFNLCPLGSGALAGQQLAWDRDRIARLLGFTGPVPHALTAVASRSWVLEIAGECSTSAVGLSRLLTDVMTWAGSEHRFVELPDDLAGISSAMPQKKNYPVLERIRGRTAHLTAWYLDVATAQRNTPYSNTVEVSKEGLAQVGPALTTMRSLLRLLATVLDRLDFRTGHARARCDEEYLGGFSLANRLSLTRGVPWRTAQVIAGEYVFAALAAEATADATDGLLLGAIAAKNGFPLVNADDVLADSMNPLVELSSRHSSGSAHPDEVDEILRGQEREQQLLVGEVAVRRQTLDAVDGHLDEVLGRAPGETGW